MITKLTNPVISASLGIVLSVGVGVAASWKTLAVLVQQTAAVVPQKEKETPPELKQKGWDFWTIEIENLSNELKEEKSRLKKQAESLDQRAARLVAEEKELAKLRADVEAMRTKIDAKVVEIAADEAKNIRSLAATYTSLTPRGAVAIFREMDDATAVKILSLMKPDIVGPIFEEMSKTAAPDGSLARRAAMLSEKLRMMKAAKAANS